MTETGQYLNAHHSLRDGYGHSHSESRTKDTVKGEGKTKKKKREKICFALVVLSSSSVALIKVQFESRFDKTPHHRECLCSRT